MLNFACVACLGFLSAGGFMAGPAEGDLVRLANWLVGSIDARAQAAADEAAGAAYKHDVALMIVRPVDDPVVFGDALHHT